MADSDADHKILVLDPVLDIKAATPLAEALLAHRGNDIIIEAAAVERLGAQSLQVLLSAIATWQADGRTLDFVHPSEAFIEGLHLFGFDADHLLSNSAAA